MLQIYFLFQLFFFIFFIVVFDDEVEIYFIIYGVFVYYVDIFFILGVYINVGIWFEFFLNVLKCFIVMKLMVDYIKNVLCFLEN